MSVRYDATLIQQYANSLYASARRLIASYALIGFVIGAPVGYFIGTTLEDGTTILTLAAGTVTAIFGASAGRSRAFILMLQAQLALCQLQVEVNTRPWNRQAEGGRPAGSGEARSSG